MTRRRSWLEDNDNGRSEDFRCYGCERILGHGGYCDSCRDEQERDRKAANPPEGKP